MIQTRFLRGFDEKGIETLRGGHAGAAQPGECEWQPGGARQQECGCSLRQLPDQAGQPDPFDTNPETIRHDNQ